MLKNEKLFISWKYLRNSWRLVNVYEILIWMDFKIASKIVQEEKLMREIKWRLKEYIIRSYRLSGLSHSFFRITSKILWDIYYGNYWKCDCYIFDLFI